MQRRDFIRVCASGVAAAGLPASLAAQNPVAHKYSRSKLVDDRGKPILASSLPAQKNLIFHYPYASTPCFLINLGKPARTKTTLKTADNANYEWTGGVGRSGSIVAYSAICAHQLAYPTRQISFISYRAEASARNKHAQVIHCCAEHSQYDPAAGARVVAGPAPQPLAAILLEHDPSSDGLFAIGTQGPEQFDAFFAHYAMKLTLEYGGVPKARAPVEGTSVVRELTAYCRNTVQC